MMFQITIRKYGDHGNSTDNPHDEAAEIALLFTETVHKVNALDYSAEQIDAWAPSPPDISQWKSRLLRTKPFVAWLTFPKRHTRSVIAGFAELETNGHIQCFYVHADYQRCGIGTLLLQEIIRSANLYQVTKLYTEVSITGKQFFIKSGFTVLGQNTVCRNDIQLINFQMEKWL